LVPFGVFYVKKDDLKESCLLAVSNGKNFKTNCEDLIPIIIISNIIGIVLFAIFSVSN